jgi:HSF-type DNA-binding
MDVLDNPRFSESISWLPHGKGFVVTDKKRFASEVLPLYFGVQTKFTSFTRKLNRW